jgi:ribosomal-protein-serine acetyltransferase
MLRCLFICLFSEEWLERLPEGKTPRYNNLLMKDLIKINNELYLRKISLHDADEVFDIIDSDRDHLRTWLPFVDLTFNSKNTKEFVEQLSKPFSQELVFTICFADKITGLIGFKEIDKINKKLEIGYWITSKYQGKGLVSASCKVLIENAFKKMDMNRIQIKCGVGNIRSSNIPKRLGFTFEGIERCGEKHNHGFINLEVYSLLRNEWNKR